MKKALVVIDMQNDFITGALGSPAAQAIVPEVVRKIKSYAHSNSQVLFTRDTHEENYLNTQEGRNLPVPHCIRSTPGWQIAEEIIQAVEQTGDLNTCPLFDKGAFGSLELAQHLKDTGPYEEIELAGLVSSICVISNALVIKAHLPEVKLTVDAACTAGVTEEDYKASLCVMKMCHVQITNEETP
ncbi:MAG: cysteine hydrolase [Peptococcaceae bacterium]|nr:cysteine hydrolase [Peptococcaceae bacterium]